MDKCIAFKGKPSQYQNEAAEFYSFYYECRIGEYSVLVPSCETEFCTHPPHLEIIKPVKLAYPARICVYCGALGDTRDHLMPRTFTGDSERSKVLTVPSCGECNSAISDALAPSITERRAIAHKHIKRKYAKTLRCLNFSEDDLSEFGDMLRAEILRTLDLKELVLSRLSWPPVGYDENALSESEIDPYEAGLLK